MVETKEEASDLPTVLVVSTPATTGALAKVLKALKVKEDATVDTEKATWTIITNYYDATVRFEALELPLVAEHMLATQSDANCDNVWNTLFTEKTIQTIIYYVEDASVSAPVVSELTVCAAVLGVRVLSKLISFR